MRLLWVIHNYPPIHNAGAETMAHNINRWLLERGHDVSVLLRPAHRAYPWEGVNVRNRGPARWVQRDAANVDVLITHLDDTRIAIDAANAAGKPLAHVLHNHRQLDYHAVNKAELLVANTRWVADEIPERLRAVPTVIVHPPTFASDYTIDAGDRTDLTLVNLIEAKGSPLFYDLARRLPARSFLAVSGAYGVQLRPPENLPNITLRPNRPDMGPVWDRTRILLVPSSYESFGKAAVEALASGIPVIAHPTPGLLESLGDAGIFVDRDDPDGWVAAIEALDKPAEYRRRSKAARARAEELDTITRRQLEELEAALEALIA